MFVINGIDVIVAIDDVPIFCGKDCTFSEEKEVIKASTVTSGIWKENRLRKRSWAIDVTGLTKINSTDGQVSYFDLIDEDSAMVAQNLSITFTDADGNIITVAGIGIMKTTQITGPATGFAEATLTIIGDGHYTVTMTATTRPSGNFAPGNAIVEVLYEYIFSPTGTGPFTEDASSVPGWVTITSDGTSFTFSGTPSFFDVGLGVVFSITISNSFGPTVFSNTINVV